MRRTLVTLVAATLLVAALPSVTSAHRPLRESDTRTSIYCEPIGLEQGTVIFGAEISELHGSQAWIAYWQDPAMPEEMPPTWVSSDGTAVLAEDGSELSSVLQMYEYVEEPTPGQFVGEATVTATLAPLGDPMPFSYGSEGTNARYREEGILQQLAIAGSGTLPGEIGFDLGACEAGTVSYSIFATSPDAWVSRGAGVSIDCVWEGDGLSAYLSLYSESDWAGGELFVSNDSGAYYGFGDVALTDRSATAEFTLVAAGEPEPEPAIAAVSPQDPVGSASVSASLSPTGERTHFLERFGTEKYRSWSEVLAVAGSLELSLPDGDTAMAMDDMTCSATAFRTLFQASSPKGSPRVKPVANDLPGDATSIAVGDSATIRDTAGTSPEAEAPCTVLDPEFGDPVELPITFTAWWTVSGDGEVTVDTAGSSFDTIVAVYVADGEGGFDQVACVDDVDLGAGGITLQAVVTFSADPGVTYHVQVGGYGYSTGRLELAVR